jgi:hypothetical protein
MSTTRQRARSSFTVEIKRANKRSPDVVAVRSAPATGNELVDHVFGAPIGKPAERPGRNQRSGESPAISPPASGAQAKGDEDGAQARPQGGPARRILPDLLSVEPDPVEQRMKQHAVEQAARRKATLDMRRSMARTSPRPESQPEVESPARAPIPGAASHRPVAERQPEAAALAGHDVSAVQQPNPARTRTKDAHAAVRKSRRAGLHPELRPGERWKRRLPQACW